MSGDHTTDDAQGNSRLPRLTAPQAAARLAVKTQTLYAYVSRGLLSRERDAHGSTFDALEIETFASARRSSAPQPTAHAAPGAPLMVLDTDIALIEDDELYFRGQAVEHLVQTCSYEQVARWLWDATGERARPQEHSTADSANFAADPAAVAAARAALTALPSGATALDRIQLAVVVLGAADPTRHDLDADAVRAAGGRLIGGVAASLATADAPGGSVARQLWSAFGERAPLEPEIRALDAALVLLVDHDLAVSTLAARAAASARATPYAVVSSGLGALDSALHGNASAAACDLVGLVLGGTDARTALARTVARTGRPAPGFGQPLYPGTDARARILLPLVAALPNGPRVADAVDRLCAQVASHTGRHPNVDLALAAFTVAAGLPSDAGAAIFAVSRIAGWIAHALDEYERRPLRLRPRGRYVGPSALTVTD